MVLSSLAVALAWSSRPVPISVELRGVRLENAAPTLAQALGYDSLSIGQNLRNDVLLVRCKDVEPDVFKENLAKVLHATWEKRSDGWRLTQSAEQKNEDQRTYERNRYQFFRELVDKAKNKLGGCKPLDEPECKRIAKEIWNLSLLPFNPDNHSTSQRIAAIDDQSPMSRLCYRMTLRITPDLWMKLTDESPRVVFSTQPNAMQQSFPFPIDDLVGQTMNEQNRWSAYASGVPLRGKSRDDDESDNSWLGNFNEHRRPFRSDDFHIVTMTLELNSRSIEVNAYNKVGKTTVTTSVNFLDDDGKDIDRQAELGAGNAQSSSLESDAREYLDLQSPTERNGLQKDYFPKISPTLLAKILHPETTDPLSISTPSVLLPAIGTSNVMMVLSEKDRGIKLQDLKALSGNVIRDSDGWILVEQPDPVSTRKITPDRQRLGNLLRFIYQNRRPLTIEERSALEVALPWESNSSTQYESHLRPLQSNEVEFDPSRSPLRIYGSLTESQRAEATKGPIPLSRLSDEVRLEIYRALFYSPKYESQVQPEIEMESLPPFGDQEAMAKEAAHQKEMFELQQLIYAGIFSENTFVLPNGLTNNLKFSIDDMSSDDLYCARANPKEKQEFFGSSETISPNSLGERLFKFTNPRKYKYETQSYNKIDTNNIRLASQRTVIMTVTLTSKMKVSWLLNQTLITDAKLYTMKTLPAKILAEIKQGYDEAEKQDKLNDDTGDFDSDPKKRIPPPRN